MSNNTNRLLNLTVLIAIVPAYIYFCSFEYEQGYCNRFNIPSYLISPNLTTILVFATSIWSILFSTIKFLGISTPLFRNMPNETKKHLGQIKFMNGVFLVIVILMCYVYPKSWALFWTFLAIGIFINLISWGFPFIFIIQRKKPLSEKISGFTKSIEKNDILSIFLDTFNTKERLFFLVVITIPFLSYFIGDGQALSQTSFQILTEKPNTVILKKYDDLFICSPIDKKNKFLGDSLILIKMSDNKEMVLRTVDIGMLRTK